MNIKTIDFQMEFKVLGDAGEFSGYASIFGNVDQGGDIVERGAFKEFDLTKDGMVRVLNQHRHADPIGKANVNEDSTGLHFDGKLLLDVPSARTQYALLKAGIVDGMSIGYDIMPGGAEMTKSGVRHLKALKLWEISTVTFGMNQLARVQAVKAAHSIKTIREFEEFLRHDSG
jgi:HK97 family phage prohead protease